MLQYKNNKLQTSEEVIEEDNSIITLNVNTEEVPPSSKILGQLLFTDGSSLIIDFIEYTEGTYKARLSLTESIKDLLKTSYFKLILIDSTTKETNLIQLKFNIEKISFSIKKNRSSDILELKKSLQALEKQINHLASGHIIDTININNKEYIKKGMILQAIDDQGNFVAVYPFTDMAKEVNGQKAINNSINLDASMIKYNQELSIKDMLDRLIDSSKEALGTINLLNDTLKKIEESYSNLSNKLYNHLQDGII